MIDRILYNYNTIQLTFYTMDVSFLQIFFFVNRISNINTTESSSHALVQSRPDKPSVSVSVFSSVIITSAIPSTNI